MIKNFGSKAPIGTPKVQKRSVFGLLFNPHLGDSIRPMGEAFSTFTTLIAMIFAMNGLFPKNHPALKGMPGARLTLSFILQTAWSGLSFTKSGMPKVLLFFAVVGAIVLSVLSIITALLYVFVGHAHAQTAATSSVFTPPNPSGDLAINWINFLFNPSTSATALGNLAATTGQTMPTTTVQTALGTALGIYSGAMLIIAAIILFYHLTAMVVETAHHGVPMGKRASQIWAPIRLVVAVGLLVPVTSSGLNSGQYIVISLAEAGSAMASNVWGEFVSTMAADSKAPPVVSAPDVTAAVYDLTMMYACEYAYNFQIYAQQTSSIATPVEYVGPGGNSWAWAQGGPPASTHNSIGKTSFTNGLENGYDMCGSYTIPAAPVMSDSSLNGAASTASTAIIAAFMKANAAAATESAKIQKFMGADFANYNSATGASLAPQGSLPTPADITTIAATYGAAVTAAVSNISISSAVSTLATNSTSEGWISGGAWFNKLSSLQGEANEIARESLPTTVAPVFSNDGGPVTEHMAAAENSHARGRFVVNTAGDSENAYQTAAKDLGAFSTAISAGAPSIASAATVAASPATSSTDPSTGCGISDPVGCILGVVLWIGEEEGVWHDNTTTTNGLASGVQFDGTSNPLLEMAQFGHANVQAGIQCFNLGIGAIATSAVSSALTWFPWAGSFFKAIATIATAVAGGLFFFGVLFFTLGAAMAFVVPLLPFMHFFFNTITWITCVAEAIIGIPLVALAHLNPEGDGLSGQAKGAYQMIFSVFLRPVMMVFGLICGLLILYIAVGLLNALYAFAVSGAGANNTVGAHAAISRIMFTVIYVALLYSVANHAFGLISRLPNYAMEWMGGKGLNGEKMGDPGHIGTAAGLATGYFSDKAAGQLQHIGSALNSAIQKPPGTSSAPPPPPPPPQPPMILGGGLGSNPTSISSGPGSGYNRPNQINTVNAVPGSAPPSGYTTSLQAASGSGEYGSSYSESGHAMTLPPDTAPKVAPPITPEKPKGGVLNQLTDELGKGGSHN